MPTVTRDPDPFIQSAKQLWLAGGTAETPSYIFIPTIKLEESPSDQEDTYYSSDNVDAKGVAFEDGVVTGSAMSYDVETKLFKTTETTPQLIAGLKELRDCKDKGEADRRKTFIIVEPDGMKKQVVCAVLSIKTMTGDTKNSGGLTCTLKRRGMPKDFSGTLPTA